jgi:DNA-binding protein H-NS
MECVMAKKAKRRGRPLGSKNKVSRGKVGKGNVSKMDVAQLRSYIDSLEKLLADKVSTQTAFFEDKLAELTGYMSRKTAGVVRAVMAPRENGMRAKPAPKYRSRKDASLKWSGRGMTPNWMKAEMKGTKLKKDDFLIA